MLAHMQNFGWNEGYWVENRFYGLKRNQAVARAEFLAKEFGRLVYVYSRTQGDNGVYSSKPIHVGKP